MHVPRTSSSHVVTWIMENNYRLGTTMLTEILVYLSLIIGMTVSFPLSFLHGVVWSETPVPEKKHVFRRFKIHKVTIRRTPLPIESFLAVRTYGQICKHSMLISWAQNTWPGQCKVLIRETTNSTEFKISLCREKLCCGEISDARRVTGVRPPVKHLHA